MAAEVTARIVAELPGERQKQDVGIACGPASTTSSRPSPRISPIVSRLPSARKGAPMAGAAGLRVTALVPLAGSGQGVMLPAILTGLRAHLRALRSNSWRTTGSPCGPHARSTGHQAVIGTYELDGPVGTGPVGCRTIHVRELLADDDDVDGCHRRRDRVRLRGHPWR